MRIRVVEYPGLGGQLVVDEKGNSVKIEDLVGKKIREVTKDKLVIIFEVE